MQGFRTPGGHFAAIFARRRRWWIAVGAGVVLLAVYAATLTWVSHRLQTAIQKSIRPLPVSIDDHRASD